MLKILHQKKVFLAPNDLIEGLALFSKFPILQESVKKFTILPADTDLNQRVALHGLVGTPSGVINFFVVHLSVHTSEISLNFQYADIVQCRQAVELVSFVQEKAFLSPRSILLGDFNTYIDYEVIITE